MKNVIIDGVEYVPKKQIKSLLADAKVGDLCQRRDGKWVQIDGIPPETLYWEADNQLYYPEGNLSLDREDEKDIIHTEPLAPEGSAEWAWQMLKLGKKVTNKQVFIGGGYILTTDSDKKEFCQNWTKRDGWKLYESEQPFAKVKVGDWVEYMDAQTRITGIPFSEDKLCPNSYWAQDADGTVHRIYVCNITRILKPSEVKVKLSLEGTVRSSINDCCFDLSTPNGGWATIGYNEIDPATAYLVRELIARQEEK